MIYWLMGRSEGSRSRVLSQNNGRVFTEATDRSKITNPELVIYNAMDDEMSAGIWVVSNGQQTDSVLNQMTFGSTLETAMRQWRHEPDAPNFTPRITGVVCTNLAAIYPLGMAIIKKSPWGEGSDLQTFQFSQVEKGFGYCLTTYCGDGNPLPPFHGEPLLMPLVGDAEHLGEQYWEALNQENRVSLVVKRLLPGLGTSRVLIFNRYTKMGQAQPDPDGYLVGR